MEKSWVIGKLRPGRIFLIEFSREALRGDQNASFYSARARETAAR
jgi:hypothetical protein